MHFPFTNPFRYSPHPLVKKAAGEIMDMLESREIDQDGKMLGVLICQPADNSDIKQIRHLHRLKCKVEENPIYYIAAFSGNVQGKDRKVTSTLEGFVPPIINLTDPKGYFKRKEAEISQINRRISELVSSSELKELKASLKKAEEERDQEIAQMQTHISVSKMRRAEIRTETSDPEILNELIKESQFQKAEFKRAKDKWKSIISDMDTEISKVQNEIRKFKSLRAKMSDDLQKWIFDNAIVHNASGESSSIWDLFQHEGLIPPGGTGDCAAPKLLEYAYKNNLQPLAMGEFWYGKSPDTAVRTHGHFYPSCTSKCGPLLSYMLTGLKVQSDTKSASQSPIIIYEDESIIVVGKPSGMPSVPGLDGRTSLQQWLNARHSDSETHSTESNISSVHRLDMDTSGVMVFAKTRNAEINLKKQFEEHSVRKTYIARCLNSARPRCKSGQIALPLSADYDERPRQKVDFKQGKPAYTEYEIIQDNPDGTTDILLYPHTGRTHQLRVHCAHILGLGSPIVGDLLYGGHTTKNDAYGTGRLCLHALSITFCHPQNGNELTFSSRELCW